MTVDQNAVIRKLAAMVIADVVGFSRHIKRDDAGSLVRLKAIRGHLIHDRDKIFAKHPDDSIKALSMELLRSPVASPKTNSIDWMTSMFDAHLRSILKSWVEQYNRGRPHSMLVPGVPDPPRGAALLPKSES